MAFPPFAFLLNKTRKKEKKFTKTFKIIPINSGRPGQTPSSASLCLESPPIEKTRKRKILEAQQFPFRFCREFYFTFRKMKTDTGDVPLPCRFMLSDCRSKRRFRARLCQTPSEDQRNCINGRNDQTNNLHSVKRIMICLILLVASSSRNTASSIRSEES